jgi:hypothetical protein
VAGSVPGRMRRATILVLVVVVVVAAAVLAPAAPAAADPPLRISAAQARGALHCQPQVRRARTEPVLLVTGTGVDGGEAWATGFQAALRRAGHPSCYLDFPDHMLGDMQVAAEYVVAGVRTMVTRPRRPIGIYGISQGGTLPRWALTFWPSLRPLVTDVVAVAGTQHGTTASASLCLGGCAPAVWQQAAGSRLVRALNRGDESPGPTAWTTVHSTRDGVVLPATGPHPSAALRGASNLVIQRVCPGRTTDHIGSGVDSVAFAALLDALGHPGSARATRLPGRICRRSYLPGLSGAFLAGGVKALTALAATRIATGPKARAEPPLRLYARRPALAG